MNTISFGRIFGFPLTVEPSAFMILALFVLMGARNGPQSAVFELASMLVVFGSVIVHELGHAFAARAYRLGPIAITLHGFGGLTRFSRAPKPGPGVLITLAGPAAGFTLGVVAYLLAPHFDTPFGLELMGTLATFNLFWSVFNLLPMYPLDGGIVTFHGLSLVVPPKTAMTWAARAGVLVAVAVGLLAVYTSQYFIGIIAIMSLARSVPLAMARPAR